MSDFFGLGVRIFFFVALLFFLIYAALSIIVLWRFSIGRIVPLALTLVFTLLTLSLLGHAFFILGQI